MKNLSIKSLSVVVSAVVLAGCNGNDVEVTLDTENMSRGLLTYVPEEDSDERTFELMYVSAEEKEIQAEVKRSFVDVRSWMYSYSTDVSEISHVSFYSDVEKLAKVLAANVAEVEGYWENKLVKLNERRDVRIGELQSKSEEMNAKLGQFDAYVKPQVEAFELARKAHSDNFQAYKDNWKAVEAAVDSFTLSNEIQVQTAARGGRRVLQGYDSRYIYTGGCPKRILTVEYKREKQTWCRGLTMHADITSHARFEELVAELSPLMDAYWKASHQSQPFAVASRDAETALKKQRAFAARKFGERYIMERELKTVRRDIKRVNVDHKKHTSDAAREKFISNDLGVNAAYDILFNSMIKHLIKTDEAFVATKEIIEVSVDSFDETFDVDGSQDFVIVALQGPRMKTAQLVPLRGAVEGDKLSLDLGLQEEVQNITFVLKGELLSDSIADH